MFHSFIVYSVVLFSASLYTAAFLISNNDIICFMSAQDWAGFILTIISIIGAVGIVGRWIVKKYVEDIMSELKPNSGSSMKDQVTRLEDKMDKMFEMMITHLEDHSKK
jgi:hypothetical protein